MKPTTRPLHVSFFNMKYSESSKNSCSLYELEGNVILIAHILYRSRDDFNSYFRMRRWFDNRWGGIFGQCMRSVPIQDREEFGELL